MAMKLKLDDAGHVVLNDGKPVYVHDDGKEIPFDAAATIATITRLNGEAKGHRERAEKVEETLKAFEGIADPAAALKALETVKNLDSKDLIAAKEVEKIKEGVAEAYKTQIAQLQKQFEPVVAERDALHQQLISKEIGSAFLGSKFIADKLAIPADIAQAAFGSAFKVKDGKLVGYDQNGEIYSREHAGEVAGFEEALSLLVERYPHRDSILKGSGASGGGAGGSGGAGAGTKVMARSAFEQLPPADRMAFIKDKGTLTE